MPSFKTRRTLLAAGGLTVGASNTVDVNGTSISAILAGSVAACMGAINASTMGSASIAITGVSATSKVFAIGACVLNASLPNGFVINNIRVGTNGASINLFNCGDANGGASTVGFHYVAYVL